MSGIPTFLRPDVAAVFEDHAVAASYRFRPSYPPQTFNLLSALIVDEPRIVLDLGCGTGFLARALAPIVDRVDALDASAAMIEQGKHLPGGDNPHLHWMVGRAEEIGLSSKYALITSGDSLHWMDWKVVLPGLAGALSPAGVLALLTVNSPLATEEQTVREALVRHIRRYTTFDEWRPDFDLVATLQERRLFCEQGRIQTEPVLVRQPVDEYVESFHARASLSWTRMGAHAAAHFDSELRALLLEHVGTVVELAVHATISWGRPLLP